MNQSKKILQRYQAQNSPLALFLSLVLYPVLNVRNGPFGLFVSYFCNLLLFCSENHHADLSLDKLPLCTVVGQHTRIYGPTICHHEFPRVSHGQGKILKICRTVGMLDVLFGLRLPKRTPLTP